MGSKLSSDGLVKLWNRIWELLISLTGNVDVTNSGTLQTQINNVKKDIKNINNMLTDIENDLSNI